jgi:hypothetical protein
MQHIITKNHDQGKDHHQTNVRLPTFELQLLIISVGQNFHELQ